MGDARHKISKVVGPAEKNTPAFRRRVFEILDRNKELNQLGGLKKGRAGYLIWRQSEIAVELGKRIGRTISQNTISNILGGAKPGTKVELVDDSTYIPIIRDILGMPRVAEITVPIDRIDALLKIADLPEADFERHRESVERRNGKS